MFDQLEKEVKEAGYTHLSLEALKDIQSNKVKITAKAHQEFLGFMRMGREMFAEKV